MVKSPIALLYDHVNSRFMKYVQEGTESLLGVAAKLRNVAGTIINPATEETVTSIKDTAGIKKITDALPAGANEIGRVRLRDDHGKDAQFSAFGLLKTAHESVLGDYRFDATHTPEKFDIVTTGTGGYTHEPGGTGLKMTTGASASSKVTLESKTTHYYQSGRGQLSKFSIILGDTGVAGNVREWGYGDTNNGVFFRMDGTTLSLVVRLNGTETTNVASTAWDTPVTPDQYGHLYYIQFEWLGVGNFFIYYDEEIVHTHSFLGTSTGLSIGTPDLPIWFRNENTTNDTDVYLKAGCASVVMEGGIIISGQDQNGELRQFSVDTTGSLRVVMTASTRSLPLMVNPYYNESIGALVANNFRRIMNYTIPAGYQGWLIRFTSWQNESSYSRIIAETEMGTLEFVANTYTGGNLYTPPGWAGTIEAEVTTQIGSSGADRTITVTYTNQNNVGSRTGTFTLSKSSIVGTRAVLELQAGDIGVQSIQNMSVSPTGDGGAIKVMGFVQLAFHDDLSATIPTETNYQPGAVAFPTGTVLGFEFRGGTVSKQRIIEALIQLVEIT